MGRHRARPVRAKGAAARHLLDRMGASHSTPQQSESVAPNVTAEPHDVTSTPDASLEHAHAQQQTSAPTGSPTTAAATLAPKQATAAATSEQAPASLLDRHRLAALPPEVVRTIALCIRNSRQGDPSKAGAQASKAKANGAGSRKAVYLPGKKSHYKQDGMALCLASRYLLPLGRAVLYDTADVLVGPDMMENVDSRQFAEPTASQYKLAKKIARYQDVARAVRTIDLWHDFTEYQQPPAAAQAKGKGKGKGTKAAPAKKPKIKAPQDVPHDAALRSSRYLSLFKNISRTVSTLIFGIDGQAYASLIALQRAVHEQNVSFRAVHRVEMDIWDVDPPFADLLAPLSQTLASFKHLTEIDLKYAKQEDWCDHWSEQLWNADCRFKRVQRLRLSGGSGRLPAAVFRSSLDTLEHLEIEAERGTDAYYRRMHHIVVANGGVSKIKRIDVRGMLGPCDDDKPGPEHEPSPEGVSDDMAAAVAFGKFVHSLAELKVIFFQPEEVDDALPHIARCLSKLPSGRSLKVVIYLDDDKQANAALVEITQVLVMEAPAARKLLNFTIKDYGLR